MKKSELAKIDLDPKDRDAADELHRQARSLLRHASGARVRERQKAKSAGKPFSNAQAKVDDELERLVGLVERVTVALDTALADGELSPREINLIAHELLTAADVFSGLDGRKAEQSHAPILHHACAERYRDLDAAWRAERDELLAKIEQLQSGRAPTLSLDVSGPSATTESLLPLAR